VIPCDVTILSRGGTVAFDLFHRRPRRPPEPPDPARHLRGLIAVAFGGAFALLGAYASGQAALPGRALPQRTASQPAQPNPLIERWQRMRENRDLFRAMPIDLDWGLP
jgi:hypothetical protein